MHQPLKCCKVLKENQGAITKGAQQKQHLNASQEHAIYVTLSCSQKSEASLFSLWKENQRSLNIIISLQKQFSNFLVSGLFLYTVNC